MNIPNANTNMVPRHALFFPAHAEDIVVSENKRAEVHYFEDAKQALNACSGQVEHAPWPDGNFRLMVEVFRYCVRNRQSLDGTVGYLVAT